jgi:ribosomal protein S18
MSEFTRFAEGLERRIKLLEDSQDDMTTSVIELNKKINMLNDYISNTHQTLNLLITNVNKKYEHQRNVQIKAVKASHLNDSNSDIDSSSSGEEELTTIKRGSRGKKISSQRQKNEVQRPEYEDIPQPKRSPRRIVNNRFAV